MTGFVHRVQTPLGGVTLASDGTALTGLWFDGQQHFGTTLASEPEERELPVFYQTERWLSQYFRGEAPQTAPALRLLGTPFCITVWTKLQDIPYGTTVSYGALAQRLGLSRGASRAVGGAVSRNPISLILPCHRVLGADGSLTGYAGGTERKRSLLLLEGVRLR